MGTVEHIGIKSTRLRSINGEQIVLANGDLLKARLRNYKRMHERRVEFDLRLPYATPVEKLEKLPGVIRAVIERQKTVRFERAHFKKLADAWLEFEVVYWIPSPDQTVFMDIQQQINLQLMAAFAREKLTFQGGAVVLTEKPPAKEAARKQPEHA